MRNLEVYEAHLQDEIDWMQNLGEPVWHLLELASDSGSSCTAIRSDCLTVLTFPVLTLTRMSWSRCALYLGV